MPDPAKPMNPTPTVSASVPTNVVYVAQPPPHVAPKPNDTPPGGKFGIVDVAFEDGERKESVRYVNAHGCEFSDDPIVNQDDKPAREKRDMMKSRTPAPAPAK